MDSDLKRDLAESHPECRVCHPPIDPFVAIKAKLESNRKHPHWAIIRNWTGRGITNDASLIREWEWLIDEVERLRNGG